MTIAFTPLIHLSQIKCLGSSTRLPRSLKHKTLSVIHTHGHTLIFIQIVHILHSYSCNSEALLTSSYSTCVCVFVCGTLQGVTLQMWQRTTKPQLIFYPTVALCHSFIQPLSRSFIHAVAQAAVSLANSIHLAFHTFTM